LDRLVKKTKKILRPLTCIKERRYEQQRGLQTKNRGRIETGTAQISRIRGPQKSVAADALIKCAKQINNLKQEVNTSSAQLKERGEANKEGLTTSGRKDNLSKRRRKGHDKNIITF
jgi:hypothetical protein